MSVELRGITWDHPRGYDPLAATARAYAASHPGMAITWEKRSLQAFADYPIEALAARYDLLVIDHPHAGAVARDRCLLPLDTVAPAAVLDDLAAHTVGRSHQSYTYQGHQWALAIDAAAQVAAFRPDLLDRPPRTWPEVLELARRGRVLWPIKPVDAISSFFTLSANLGTPCAAGPDLLIPAADGRAVLEAMRELRRLVPDRCLRLNPFEVLEWLSGGDQYAYCPLLFGYTNYARDGFRPHPLRFADIPALGDAGPRGALLGGTGLAVSARCAAIDAAVDYACWVAGAETQRGLYAQAGGQPGHAAAWEDDAANGLCRGFFRDTRATLEGAWLRPRYDGYIGFQDRAGDLLNQFLAGARSGDAVLDDLNRAYRESRR